MLLAGKKGLVLNVTNRHSIGWAIADAAHKHGAIVGVGAQNERMLGGVTALLDGRERFHAHQVDFQNDEELESLAAEVDKTYGKIDFLVHSAAFANRDDLSGRFIDTSRDGFKLALEISAYSFVRLCKVLEPSLADDASVVTLSYIGSVRTAGNYNVMGVAKAALESATRYLAVDLGTRGIKVNALSPGPINTVAARGVRGLSSMIDHVHERAPLKRRFGQEEVAGAAVYLMSDLCGGVTGQVIYIDNGYNIVGL